VLGAAEDVWAGDIRDRSAGEGMDGGGEDAGGGELDSLTAGAGGEEGETAGDGGGGFVEGEEEGGGAGDFFEAVVAEICPLGGGGGGHEAGDAGAREEDGAGLAGVIEALVDPVRQDEPGDDGGAGG